MKRSMGILIAITLIVMFWGCGAKVKTRYLTPAKYNVAGIKKLVVADFKTNYSAWSRSGRYISELIRDELSGSEFYELIPASPSIGADAKDGWDSKWMRWGKKRGVDGILAGTVSKASVNYTKYRRKKEKKVKTGKYREETYWENGQKKTRRKEIIDKRIYHIPIVKIQARLRVKTALLNVSTARSISSNSYNEYETEEYEGNEIKYMPSDRDILKKMAQKVALNISKDLVPHAVSQNLSLASDDACKEGNKLAQKGQWDAAVGSWKSVLASNSQNHAALYNLGVAAEVAKQYKKAEEYYLTAIDINDKRIYRKALKRVGKKIRQDEVLKRQLKGR